MALTLESHHHRWLSTEPNGVVHASGPAPAAYEQWTPELLGNGRYAFRAPHPPHRYLRAEGGGGSHQTPAVLDTRIADYPKPREWETWTVERHGEFVALRSWDGSMLSAQEDGRLEWRQYTVEEGPGPWELWRPVPADFGDVVTPPVPSGPTVPLVGVLRVGPNQSFADETGPRQVLFCSDFPALRVWRDERDRQLRRLDSIVGYYQGVRSFWNLADPWAPDALDYGPFSSGFDETLYQYLVACTERNLRVQLTAGDLQYLPAGTSLDHLYRRVGDIARSVNEQVVAVSEMVNEARVNSSQQEDWAYWAARSRTYQGSYPWGIHGLSDPGSQEEPAGLIECSQNPANVALLHGTRQDWISAIRRAFNVRFDGFHTHPIVQGEPTNMHGPAPGRIKVYQPLASEAQVFGLYSMIVLTGQMLTYFGDAALTNRQPLESDPLFRAFPEKLLQMNVPQDVGTYVLIPGHRQEAPVTIEGIPDASRPDRCDNMVAPDGKHGFAVVYGNQGINGRWRVLKRDGGFLRAHTVTRMWGGTAELIVDVSEETAVIEWHR